MGRNKFISSYKADHKDIPCPECGSEVSCVTDTRAHQGARMRKRQCRNGHRFQTVERVTILKEGMGLPVGAAISPFGMFTFGQLVEKTKGSWWRGKVVGTYSTDQTPIGYAVQLPRPMGPVQIYPESALEAVPHDH